MAGFYELKRAGTSQFMFNLKAGNNEKILTSETYTSKSGAENGIASVKKNASTDTQYERKTASNGSPYFILKATNGETIGTSELYTTTAARDAGIQSVKTNAPTAPVKDLT